MKRLALLLVILWSAAAAAKPARQEQLLTEDQLNEVKLPKGHKGKYKILKVPLHYQSTAVWCWAASISMVHEFFYHEPVDDCEVTTKISIKAGSGDQCCNYERGTASRRCYRGARAKELTEAAEFYFRLHVGQIGRPLTWEELTTELNAGHPPILGLITGPGMGHAVVLYGYAEPDLLFFHDPVLGPKRVRYQELLGRRSRTPWYMTWTMSPTDRTVFGTSKMPPPLADASKDSGESKVAFDMPLLADAAIKAKVLARISKESGTLRACYQQGLKETPPAEATGKVAIVFTLDKGSPTWLKVKDPEGLTKNVTTCLTDTIIRWKGLFPDQEGKKTTFDESQRLELTFTSMAPPTSGEALTVTGQ